jgi:hypothetical protein
MRAETATTATTKATASTGVLSTATSMAENPFLHERGKMSHLIMAFVDSEYERK